MIIPIKNHWKIPKFFHPNHPDSDILIIAVFPTLLMDEQQRCRGRQDFPGQDLFVGDVWKPGSKRMARLLR
jgi:hypothetical protein